MCVCLCVCVCVALGCGGGVTYFQQRDLFSDLWPPLWGVQIGSGPVLKGPVEHLIQVISTHFHVSTKPNPFLVGGGHSGGFGCCSSSVPA